MTCSNSDLGAWFVILENPCRFVIMAANNQVGTDSGISSRTCWDTSIHFERPIGIRHDTDGSVYRDAGCACAIVWYDCISCHVWSWRCAGYASAACTALACRRRHTVGAGFRADGGLVGSRGTRRARPGVRPREAGSASAQSDITRSWQRSGVGRAKCTRRSVQTVVAGRARGHTRAPVRPC